VPAGARTHSDAELDALAEIESRACPWRPTHAHRRGASAAASARRSTRAARGTFGDQRDILGGAGQNVIGLAAGSMTTFGRRSS
jgi:hypothetical protein